MEQSAFGAPIPNPLAALTPAGLDAILSQFISASTAISIISALSALMVVFLLVQLIMFTFFPGGDGTGGERAFLRTQLGLYTFCLLLTNLATAIGGLLQALWAIRAQMGDELLLGGDTSVLIWDFGACQAQGWLFQIGDVGSAVWGFVMAVHAFRTLVLRRIFSTRIVALFLLFGWVFILFFAFAGPAIVQGRSGISFYGPVISDDGPLWCWIYYPYPSFQLWFHYLFLILAAVSSAILYPLVYIVLRRRQRRMSMYLDPENRYEAWLQVVVKKMLVYPVAYIILILPLTICRLATLAGVSVSSLAFLVSFSIFSFSGFVNGLLLIWASKVLQTKQWQMLIDHCRGRQPRNAGSDGILPTRDLLQNAAEEKEDGSPGFTIIHPNFIQGSYPRGRARLQPFVTVRTTTPDTSNKLSSETLERIDSAASTASKYSVNTQRTMPIFMTRKPSLPPARPGAWRKPVPPILPKRNSLRPQFKRFSDSVSDKLKALEGVSPVDGPVTSIIERFPLPPLLEKSTEAVPNMAASKRASRSAPTSPHPKGPRLPNPFPEDTNRRTLPSHPAVFCKPAVPEDEIPKAATPTPTDLILSALRSDNGGDSDSDYSAGSLTPLSAHRHSTFSAATVTPKTYRRSRLSTRKRFTVKATSDVGSARSSTKGIAL